MLDVEKKWVRLKDFLDVQVLFFGRHFKITNNFCRRSKILSGVKQIVGRATNALDVQKNRKKKKKKSSVLS